MALQVREIGSFHIGGRTVTLQGLPPRDMYYTASAKTPIRLDPNGDYHVEQMYVQYVKLESPRARYPLLMIHGGRSTGVTWETTPDGRPGFQMEFLQRGHDVYLSDAVERGRASWAPPEVWKLEPFFPVAKTTWEISRIGPPESYATDPADRAAYSDTKYPIEFFDQQMKQRAPRWVTNDAATQAAYDLYIGRVGPCVLMAHSTGGPFALQMALNAPDKVKSLILLEPAGAPRASPEQYAKLKSIPHLYIWGDHTEDEPTMRETIPLASGWRDGVVHAGGHVDWLELPKLGIRGNSHQMMMDRNSAEIAELVQSWMTRQGLMKE